MPQKLDNSSLEEVRKYIYNLDFSKIIEKMVSHQGWLLKDAVKISNLYRDFLFLQKKYGRTNDIIPSNEVDEFWHNHILDTRKYQEDCKVIFGEYLHHYPYFGIDETSNMNDVNVAFETTLSLYLKEFKNDHFAYRTRTFFSKLLGKFKLGRKKLSPLMKTKILPN